MREAAFHTGTRRGSVALGEGGEVVALRAFGGDLAHARELLPTLDALLAEQGWARDSLELIRVDLGPGSFTGLRIGLVTAKVLALALETRLLGIDSCDAAAAASAGQPWAAAPFLLALDARRETLITRRYQRWDEPAEASFQLCPIAELPTELPCALDASARASYADRLAPRTLHPLGEPDAATLLRIEARELDPRHAVPSYGLSGVRGS